MLEREEGWKTERTRMFKGKMYGQVTYVSEGSCHAHPHPSKKCQNW